MIGSASELLEFEWDDDKELANLRKHGVDFLTASAIFRNPVIDFADDREEYGEARAVAIGRYGLDIYRVVYSLRSERSIRIISAQKASRNERERYYREIHPG